MYTLTTITTVSDSAEKSQRAIEAAFRELDRLEKMLNYYDNSSEIAAINSNAGIRPVKVSPETMELIAYSIYVAQNTGGAFDITMGPVISLWDFKKRTMPDNNKLKARLDEIGYKKIVLDKKASTAFLRQKGMEINLGGILKGYAAEKAADMLKRNAIKSGIVAVAGDIQTFGTKPDSSLWNVGVQNPRQTGKDDGLLAVADLKDKAISTAGDYEQFFIRDGIRYHHILSTQTGYPVSECRSVTVIADKGIAADGFDTAIFILGPKKGMEVMKKLGLDGIIVDKMGNVTVTEGIRKNVRLISELKSDWAQ
jgi:thiamine biosynthesis lipoprotein